MCSTWTEKGLIRAFFFSLQHHVCPSCLADLLGKSMFHYTRMIKTRLIFLLVVMVTTPAEVIASFVTMTEVWHHRCQTVQCIFVFACCCRFVCIFFCFCFKTSYIFNTLSRIVSEKGIKQHCMKKFHQTTEMGKMCCLADSAVNLMMQQLNKLVDWSCCSCLFLTKKWMDQTKHLVF